jgi:hypothetical protein
MAYLANVGYSTGTGDLPNSLSLECVDLVFDVVKGVFESFLGFENGIKMLFCCIRK